MLVAATARFKFRLVGGKRKNLRTDRLEGSVVYLFCHVSNVREVGLEPTRP